jgi:small ligand-binding sensory domain FIST
MSTSVGVGFSDLSDSFAAGVAAARAALHRAGTGACDLAWLFATSKHDAARLRDGVRSVIGARPRLVGGYAVGIITNDALGYEGFQVGVATFASDTMRVDILIERNLASNERAVGARLGARLAAEVPPDAGVVMVYDAVNRTEGRLKLNMATPLLDGVAESWPQERLLVGAGLVGDMQCKPTFQWLDDEIVQQSAVAMAFSGSVRIDSDILHGCRPASSYRTITRSEGPTVLEIDGRPALDVIAELLGPEAGKTWRDYAFFITLGVNRGGKYAPFREENYVNRLCLRADPQRGALVMFEPDLVAGTQVQLMRRSVEFDYVRERTQALLDRTAGRRPFFVFYIDCAGRAGAYSGADGEEAAEVQSVVGDIPLLGIYSGAEIGRVAGAPRALDFTGVPCVFSE